MTRTVAVTGATGFIGSALLPRLTAAGWQVRALTRRPQPARAGVFWVQGALDDRAALATLVDNTEAVVHLAGAVRGADAKAFQAVNVQGTGNLIDVCQQQRFLLVSSLAAREPALSWYADSKHRAEQVLATSALAWTILRPTAVYGPGDQELKPLLALTRKGWLPLISTPDARLGLIHVADVVSAMLAWLERGEHSPGQTLELDDGRPGGYTHQTLAALLSEFWRRPVRVLAVPAWPLRGIAWANVALARLFHYAPMLSPGKVNELRHADWTANIEPARQALGFVPEMDFLASLHHTFESPR
ncbi:MAG: NAD-dependent epimerase/dehydratase family protein [Methylococcales bacterium]|nr:NAD-dependent epimerase/dehydratase family protein [Methylococcales bacterium]